MQAFDNPVFVEDMVRNVALVLRSDLRVAWFRIHALNQESIHNHSAFADVEWARPALESKKDLTLAENACA
jgi:GTP cyclohydrolase I